MNISKRTRLALLVCFISLSSTVNAHSRAHIHIYESATEQTDAEKLSRAVDYFQSGKFHEALIWFSKLDSKYKLNPRFQAYMGVCCYYDGEYERAVATLEPILTKLNAFAPHELAVYYYCVAESYFRLKKYIDAVPLFEKHTCYAITMKKAIRCCVSVCVTSTCTTSKMLRNTSSKRWHTIADTTIKTS